MRLCPQPNKSPNRYEYDNAYRWIRYNLNSSALCISQRLNPSLLYLLVLTLHQPQVNSWDALFCYPGRDEANYMCIQNRPYVYGLCLLDLSAIYRDFVFVADMDAVLWEKLFQ